MTRTNDLIERLTTDVQPVQRLRHPLRRTAVWLLCAACILGLLVLEHGMRPDIADQLRDGAFRLRLGGSLATGLLAALACMIASMPDRSRLWLLLPAPALALWLSTIGYGCLTDWVVFDSGRMQPGEAWRCLATLLLISLPLSVAMLLMLRHVARLRPGAVTLTAGLAVAAVTATAMSILHQLDASAMILLWNLGAAVVIVPIEAALGGRMLAWLDRALAS